MNSGLSTHDYIALVLFGLSNLVIFVRFIIVMRSDIRDIKTNVGGKIRMLRMRNHHSDKHRRRIEQDVKAISEALKEHEEKDDEVHSMVTRHDELLRFHKPPKGA